MPISKPYLTYCNRIKAFDVDVELIDLIGRNRKRLSGGEQKIFFGCSPTFHPILSALRPTEQSRKIAFGHLKRTVCVAYIKDVYEELNLYLKSIIEEASLNLNTSAGRIIGEHPFTISAKEILSYASLEEIVKRVVEDLFQKIEACQNTKDIIKAVCAKLDVKVDNATIELALPYLEIRHKLVHTNGIVDQMFKQKFPTIKYSSNSIAINTAVAKDMSKNVTKLVQELDRKLLAKGLLTPHNQR